jgi:alkylation response protein AidB-like acyl-CoA dehydrogenase
MDRPGIDFRPLRTIAGSTEFGELFLDNVRVPVANRVGDENDGWRVTMTTLSFERGTAFVGEVLQSMELLRGLRDMAQSTGAWDEASVRRRVGHLGAELDALWALARRNVSQAARTGVPGIGGSVYKLALSELRQRIADLGMDLAGPAGLVFGAIPGDAERPVGNLEVVSTWVHGFSRTIAAGTSQIQRNIIAERILGLPKG